MPQKTASKLIYPVVKLSSNHKSSYMPKYIESIETEKVQLDVIECDCGFHIGLDATYIDQVDEVNIECPSCGITISSTIIS